MSETQTPQMEPLLTYPEAAEVLGVTGRTIQNLVARGDLKCVRVGRNVRIDPSDLRAFIERCKHHEAAGTGREGVSHGME